jgi:hypothetical protein
MFFGTLGYLVLAAVRSLAPVPERPATPVRLVLLSLLLLGTAAIAAPAGAIGVYAGLALLLLATAGGFILFSLQLRGRLMFAPMMLLHGLIAATEYLFVLAGSAI